MSSLQEERLGVFIQNGTMSAFLKQVPSKVEESHLQQHQINMTSYKASFMRKNFDLPNHLKDALLMKDPLGQDIEDYLKEQQENAEP